MLQDRPEDFWLLSDNSRLTKGEAQKWRMVGLQTQGSASFVLKSQAAALAR